MTQIASKIPYTGPTYKFKHQRLGELAGRLIQNPHFDGVEVVQFRSIPFATIPRRFEPSILLSEIPKSFDDRPYRDFTQFSSACPQPDGMTEAWFDPYGGRMEDEIGMTFDEFTCCTVSISVPKLALENHTTRLPVMVYVHGGAAQDGMGAVDGLHDNAALASFAAQLASPVILVNVGYRLNWLANLVCKDLIAEHESSSNKSTYGPFNLDIQDQRNAFSWIHSQITGFGGDTNNITAFAESAGSIYLNLHICSAFEIPPFKRAILQSGAVLGHSTLEEKEVLYQGLLKHFNINANTPEARLDQLRKIPAEELARYPSVHLHQFFDALPGQSHHPLFPHGAPTNVGSMALVRDCPWLEDIIVGDDFFEGWVLAKGLVNADTQKFAQALSTAVGASNASKILTQYSLPLDGKATDGEDLFIKLSILLGDVLLSEPMHRLAKTLGDVSGIEQPRKRKVYRYSFALSNPIPGSEHTGIIGHHFVEILFIFLTLLDRYPKDKGGFWEKMARETARRWIAFANGLAPWDEFEIQGQSWEGQKKAKIAIVDDSCGWELRTIEEDEEKSKTDASGIRRYQGWEMLEQGYQSLRKDGDSDEVWGEKVNVARKLILNTASYQKDA